MGCAKEICHGTVLLADRINNKKERQNMQMKEILKKLIDAGKKDALDSLEDLTNAAKELGYSDKEIDEALDGFDGFPLDDDDLVEITGGHDISCAPIYNRGRIYQV